MKREIKFRAWDGEKMISPDSIYRDGTAWWKENSIPCMTNIVMQFTGLLDKNGKEIYEGDVDATGIVVKWDERAASFICVRDGSFIDLLGEVSSLLAITGNIHEPTPQ